MEPVHVHYPDGGYAAEIPEPGITVGQYLAEFGVGRAFEGVFELRRDGVTLGLDDPIESLAGLHVACVRLDGDEIPPGAVAFAVLDTDLDTEQIATGDDDYPADGNVDEILDWAGTDPERVAAALETELARGKPRMGIVDPLTEQLAELTGGVS